MTRRGFLVAAGGLGLLALVPAERLSALAASAPRQGHPGRYLTAHELDTLRAVAARLIPGPPDDPDPGATEAGCAVAIDLLLGAFTFTPPLIHAGGPFSDRAGSPVDEMARFVPLDRLAELGWRIRLEGSRGMREREFAGPVVGLQQTYRGGLAHLDIRARRLGFSSFTIMPGPSQDLLLSDQTDGDLQNFVGAALANALEAMYGPPEYGGNRHRVGWTSVHWPGDVQPRGFTARQVSFPDSPGSRSELAMAPADARSLLGRFAAGLGVRRATQAARWLGGGVS
jgi:gluconate 2-dehydrogenase subunit 3-like protein